MLSPRSCFAVLAAALLTLPVAALGAPPPAAPEVQVDAPPPVVLNLGKGPPKTTVIFMHGLGGSPEGYEPLLRDLLTPTAREGAVRVVAIWMRPENGPHTMTDQLARARRAIDAEPGPVVLMGHSFGGKAALKLAAEYPKSKVSGVIALAPSVNMLQSYWKRLTGERVLPAPDVVARGLAAHEAQLAASLREALASGDEERIDSARGALSYARVMRDMVGHDEPGTETHVSRPTLVLHGTEDGAVSIHYARRFADANASSVKLVELEGVDHGFDAERPQIARMRSEVRAFLASNASSPPAARAPVAAPPPPRRIFSITNLLPSIKR